MLSVGMVARGPRIFSYAVGLAVMTAAREMARSPEDVCASLGLSLIEVRDPLHRVAHDEFARVWRTLDEQIYGFGLRAARVGGTAPQSLAEYAIANAATMRGAMQCWMRLQGIFHEASAHELVERGDRYVNRFKLAPPLPLPHAVGDALAAMVTIKTRVWIEDPGPPLVVRLTRPVLDAPELAAEIFQCPIEVGVPVAEVEWPRAALERPLLAADPALFKLINRQIEAALGLPESGVELLVMSDTQRDPVLALKRHLAKALPSGRFSIDESARALSTTPRSLQRRLAERGKRYQEVLDESRHALAIGLLGTDKNLAEAALATGFSDLPAFVRAFRRWTGTTPGDWVARRHRASAGRAGART
jgi:AraC-like DNA-binding protein